MNFCITSPSAVEADPSGQGLGREALGSYRGEEVTYDSRRRGIDPHYRESQESIPQGRLSKSEATDIIVRMEMSAVRDPQEKEWKLTLLKLRLSLQIH